MFKAFKYRLYPTVPHAEKINQNKELRILNLRNVWDSELTACHTIFSRDMLALEANTL